MEENIVYEMEELARIYQHRGLKPKLAREVAEQLMDHDALEAHARDDIGISEAVRIESIMAVLFSACSFVIGGALPVLAAWLVHLPKLIITITVITLGSFAILGGIAASVGGALIAKGAVRVCLWGVLAMGITAVVGRVFVIIV